MKSKLVAFVLSLFIVLSNITPIFAHNAVYFDVLVDGNGNNYKVIARDDMQSSTEAGHYEFQVGGYFFGAGLRESEASPLYVYNQKIAKDLEKTKKGDIKFRGPGEIKDPNAEADRKKYYEYFKKYNNSGLSTLGKVFTFPPTNAKHSTTKKFLHMDTTHIQIQQIQQKLGVMIEGFNTLLEACGTNEPGQYESVGGDFMATSEMLADAISNGEGSMFIPIMIDEKKYNSVEIKIHGGKYDATVIRDDGKAYYIKDALRFVRTGFLKDSDTKRGDFLLDINGKKELFEHANLDTDRSWLGKIGSGISSVLYTENVHSATPYRQNYDWRRDIPLVTCVVAANMKREVRGEDTRNSYMNRDESILSRETTKFINSVISSLSGLLKLQDYNELIFNQGARDAKTYNIKSDGSFEGGKNMDPTKEESEAYQKNDPYVLGIYRLSWHTLTMSFNGIFLILGIMVIAYSFVKLILHLQAIAVSPYFRNQAYQTFWNYALIVLLLPSVWIVWWLLAQANYYIVSIFGSSVDYTSLTSLAITSASGTIGSVLIGAFYFTMLIYFNVIYVLRSVNIAILMAVSPLAVSTLSLGGEYKSVFDSWSKEVVQNIFLQSFHAFFLTFIVGVQAYSSGIEQLILVMSLIPLTGMYRNLLIGRSQTVSMAESQGSQLQQTATSAMQSTAMSGFKVAGAAIGAASSIYSGKQNSNLSKAKNEKNPNKSGTVDHAKWEDNHTNKLAALAKKAETGKTVAMLGQDAKKALPIAGKVATGGALALTSNGKSLIGAIDGAGDLTTSGAETLDSLLNNKMSRDSGKEALLNIKDFGSNVASISADKNTITTDYGLSKGQQKDMSQIFANDGETQDNTKAYLQEQGFDIRQDSKVSMNPSTGAVSVEHANTTGVMLTTVGAGNVVARSFEPEGTKTPNVFVPQLKAQATTSKGTEGSSNGVPQNPESERIITQNVSSKDTGVDNVAAPTLLSQGSESAPRESVKVSSPGVNSDNRNSHFNTNLLGENERNVSSEDIGVDNVVAPTLQSQDSESASRENVQVSSQGVNSDNKNSHFDTKLFGGNERNVDPTSTRTNNKNEVIANVTPEINQDIKQFEKEYKAEKGSDCSKDEFNTALKDYVNEKYGINNIGKDDKNKQYYINSGRTQERPNPDIQGSNSGNSNGNNNDNNNNNKGEYK